jgi:flagellar protein FliL
MSKNAKPAATKPADAAVAPAPNSKKKLVIIVVAVVAIAAVAGWFFTRGKSDTAHVEEVKVAPPKRAIFIALEPFTVNLQKETSEQYLQVGITLKFFEPELEERIKASLPEVRSKILLLLATKKASELASPEGKTRLMEEISTISNAVLGIVNKPAQAASAVVAANAASHAAEAATEGDHGAATEPAVTPEHPATPKAEEKQGIVDVLFTSFIIQ